MSRFNPLYWETMMRFYTGQHRFYCGVDLHARTIALCVLDADGHVAARANVAASPAAVLDALAPFRNDVVVACECMFAWYWLADLCHEQQIPFVLGHALYMKAIHGGKTKNDKIDAEKIARLLRGGNLPVAYVYPKAMRDTRDLLRRRTFLVRRRAELLAHVVNTNSQYNLPPLAKKLSYAANREELDVAARFADPSVHKAVEADLALIDACDEQIRGLELYLTRTAKVDDPQTYQRLRSIPGVGPILALVMLYEIHDIRRFPEVGHLPVLRPAGPLRPRVGGQEEERRREEDRQRPFEVGLLRGDVSVSSRQRAGQGVAGAREKKRGKARALGAFAARLGRAVYHMLRKKEAFDVTRFFAS